MAGPESTAGRQTLIRRSVYPTPRRFIGALRLAAWLAAAACVAMPAHADCVRTTPGAGKRPDLDGPGSFGRLQDTVTLGCLAYIGTIGNDKTLQALVRDDRGEIHRMRVGDYMGENTGVIRKIEPDAITIEQITMNGAQPVTRAVRFKRAAP